MIKELTIIFLVLLASTCLGQVRVTGTVVFKDDQSTAPGITVIEKGTENGTLTNMNGVFELAVSDSNAVLVFSFIGVQTQEFKLNGKSEILVQLKLDCYKDFFDSNEVHIYANSGVINNPIGGQIDLASPWTFLGVIKGSYGYQINLYDNQMQTVQIELLHSIGDCGFDIDFRWTNRQVKFANSLDLAVNSFESDLNLREAKIIAGYSHLDFAKIEPSDHRNRSGVVIGVGRYFNLPLHPTAIVKVGLYKDKIEYQGLIQGGHRRFLCFIKFYKLNSFNELSLGVGTGFGYRTRRWRE